MTQVPGPDELLFLPLGGTGEIGMNLNLYGHDGSWLMVDLGITFAGPNAAGVDVLMPDPAFIVEQADRLSGLVLTHAHEDHIGAVAHLWPMLRCPIYATAFTASMLEPKLIEADLEEEAEVTILPLSGKRQIGPFEIDLITLTHSIPEPNALVIRTGAGAVLHTGDWKLDEEPLVGESYDRAALQALAEEQILAMVCDSTNALVDGDSGSEGEVRESLIKLMSGLKNRVAVACFASNVARLDTVAEAAKRHGRRLVLMGRSMRRVFQAARDNGYLADFPPLVSEEESAYLDRSEVLILCTGSQGEPRSALARIARGEDPNVHLEPGDAVIFSSRIIPGNDLAIYALQNRLASQGVEIITDDDHFVHVSGHPARDELAQMYQWVKPKIAVPVHGEERHLTEHARLAAECQVPQQIVGRNGSLIRLAPGHPDIIDEVPSGRLALDGTRLVHRDSAIFRERMKMANNGHVAATLVIGADGLFQGLPVISTQGLFEETGTEDGPDELLGALVAGLRGMPPARRRDDAELKDETALLIRRHCRKSFGKKPQVSVHVIRLRESEKERELS
jgi:ribonuclease J